MIGKLFDRVTLPGLPPEEIERTNRLHAQLEWREKTEAAFIRALLAKGNVFMGKRKPARKPTKHQRHQAKVKVRSAYLKAVAS